MCDDKKQVKKKKYINGLIDVDLMPKNIYDAFIISLKLQIYEYYNNISKNNHPK